MSEGATVGQLLQQARVAKGLSREALALELKLPLRHIEAIEGDDWNALPPGRPRPLARQLAQRLGVDLEYHTGAFQYVPGALELEPPDPKQERLERLIMGLLTLASVLLVLWLVVPGPSLGHRPAPSYLTTLPKPTLPPPPPPSQGPHPVLGELLPEAPLTEQGILVSLRALDTAEARLEVEGEAPQARTLHVSEPWRLRVKGPFSLVLDNAGVVAAEVAGKRIPHGQNVGASWTGRFDAQGRWLRPMLSPPAQAEPAPPDVDEDEPRP
jgi:transcriptional regulator with XRE-family HTH domain